MSFRRCAERRPGGGRARPREGPRRGCHQGRQGGRPSVRESPLAVAPLRAGAEMALVQGLLRRSSDGSAGGHEARRGSARLERRVGGRRLRAPSRPRAVPQAPLAGRRVVPGPPRRRRRPSPGTAPRWSRRRRPKRLEARVYALPAFINHGCARNACKVVIGHTRRSCAPRATCARARRCS